MERELIIKLKMLFSVGEKPSTMKLEVHLLKLLSLTKILLVDWLED